MARLQEFGDSPLLSAMQSDRINISLFFAALGCLAFATGLAIARMHREFSIAMVVAGLFIVGCANRIAAAQHALADRPRFPKHWKKSKPLQFVFSGAAIAVLGIAGLMSP
jgi:hypothetical protein